jgi:uncharacterized protein (UPF0333 family)
MSKISTPGIDVDVSWPLVAGIGILVAGIVWLVYDIFNKSGASHATAAAADAIDSVGTLAQAPIDAVSGAIDTLAAPNGSAQTPGSNSSLFYTGISNFFKTGSIYDSGN